MPKARMDLWWNAVDDNVLPLNPDWGMQVNSDGTTNGRVPDAGQLCNNFHDEGDNLQLGNPSCTTQRPTVDEPSVWSDPAFWTVCQASGGVAGAVHGHINWGLATYTGKLFFTDHSNPVPSGLGDDDYDMTLQRTDQASATATMLFPVRIPAAAWAWSLTATKPSTTSILPGGAHFTRLWMETVPGPRPKG
jgi:hypothetical protein